MKLFFSILIVLGAGFVSQAPAHAGVPSFQDFKVDPETVAQMIGPRQLIVLYKEKPLNILHKGKLNTRKDRFVSSMAVIAAPPGVVRDTVLDFTKYVEYMPQTKKTKILNRKADEITVAYELEFEAPILNLSVDYSLSYKLEPSGAISWHLIEGDLGENVGRWEFLPLAGNRTLAVYTNWTDVESMSFALRIFLRAEPDLKLAMPVASSAIIVDSIRRRVEKTVDKPPATVASKLARIPLITGGGTPLSVETVVRLAEAGTVLFVHPKQWLQTETGPLELLFVSAAGLVPAPLKVTRRLSTDFGRYSEFLPQVAKTTVNQDAQNLSVDWQLKLGLGILSLPIKYSVAYAQESTSAVSFHRTRGDIEHIYGAYEWLSPSPGQTVLIYTTASQLGNKAPAILKLGNLIPDRQLTIGASSTAVLIENLRSWIVKQKKSE